jgi:site-specific DNA-methyltransferase (adenine-specific)
VVTTHAAPSPIDFRLGRYQDVLADVGEVSCVIADPPYSERTHDGSDAAADIATDAADRQRLAYEPWTPEIVRAFVAFWAPRTRGWICGMTDDILVPAWRAAYEEHGRLDFAPVPCLQHKPRLGGDGPGSGVVYLVVSRPRESRFMSWGSLPCWYQSRPEHAHGIIGAKPLDLMRAIIRDYSRPGDLVCDPCAGGATTLLAAALEGRRAVGAEMDPTTFAKASKRLRDAAPRIAQTSWLPHDDRDSTGRMRATKLDFDTRPREGE